MFLLNLISAILWIWGYFTLGTVVLVWITYPYIKEKMVPALATLLVLLFWPGILVWFLSRTVAKIFVERK